MIYQLFKLGSFVFGEIEQYLGNRGSFLLCYYFRKDIYDFGNLIKHKSNHSAIGESFFKNENDIDQMIEYGFSTSSIEYCLKYDSIVDLYKFDNFIKKQYGVRLNGAFSQNISIYCHFQAFLAH